MLRRFVQIALLVSVGLLNSSFAQQSVSYELTDKENYTVSPVDGDYELASYRFSTFPHGGPGDGVGMRVTLTKANQGVLVYCPYTETGPGDVLIECFFRTTGSNVRLFLGGLNAPVDGSIVANMPANASGFVREWNKMKVYCDPPDDAVLPVFQIVSLAHEVSLVSVDRVVVTPLAGLSDTELVDQIRSFAPAAKTPSPTPTPRSAIRVESGEPQLFVDDLLIERTFGLKRTLRQPVKDEGGNVPVISLADEFEGLGGTLEANGTIVFDPRLNRYVMFALAFSPQWKSSRDIWQAVRLYRFTSEDGMQWVKGDDGTPQCVFPRQPDDLLDVESGARATNIDLFSCYYDVNDPNFPYKGWLYFANWGDEREGIYYMRSRDGIHWERGQMILNATSSSSDTSCRELHAHDVTLKGPGDVTIFYHDEKTGRYLAAFKFYTRTPVWPGNALRSRAYAFLDRIDEPWDTDQIERLALVPAAAEKNGDMPTDEYYASTGWRYGSHWLGGLKIWHSQDDYPYSSAGCAFLKLISSSDGLQWVKVPFENGDGYREVWVPNGAEGGNGGRNDGGYMTQFSQGPLRIGDELVYYYGASSYGKNQSDDQRITGGGIFRARLRVDGFVSVDAGSLTTRLLEFDGDDLLVNAAGQVVVSVLSSDGRLLGAAVVEGDDLAHEVRFNGKSLAEISSDAGVRLHFEVLDGSLYSFTVQ